MIALIKHDQWVLALLVCMIAALSFGFAWGRGWLRWNQDKDDQ